MRLSSLFAGVAVISSVAIGGCGGGGSHADAGKDMTSADMRADTATDTQTGDAADTAGDMPPSGDGGDGPVDMAPGDDATDANPDVADGSDASDANSEEGPPVVLSLFVDAVQNRLPLDACNAVPATFTDVPAGMHTLQLTASTLSKGSVMSNEAAIDNYVIVHVPLPAGDPMEKMRFFMLNGIGSTADFTLPAVGTVGLFFIDSDAAFNSGQGTLLLAPDGTMATVDAMANVIHWTEGCATTPASLTVSDRTHRATLFASTLSSGTGAKDDYVILKLPSERAMDDRRYVILNGVGSSVDFTPSGSTTVRAWFLTATSGGTGLATIRITDL